VLVGAVRADDPAQIMDGLGMDADEQAFDQIDIASLQRQSFAGKEVHLSAQNEISVADLWTLLRQRQWSSAWPWLLLVGGLFGVVVLFGPLLWYLLADQRWVAYLLMGLTLWMFIQIGWRTSRGG